MFPNFSRTFQGMDSGFGHEDDYNVYDKPWRKDQGISGQLYRPRGDRESAEDLETMIKTSRLESMVLYVNWTFDV